MNTTSKSNISLRTAAIIAGAGLLLMAILSPIAYLNTFQSLVKFDDAALTAQNILNSVGAFRTAIMLLFVVALLDIIVAWAIYIVLIPADKTLSAVTAWLRVIYGIIFAFAIFQLFHVLNVVAADSAQAMSYLKAFQSIWDKALIIFGFHLLLLGYLAFKSGYVPKWLAVLIVVAGIGYVVDGFGKWFSPAYNISVAQFTFIGEVILIFWLFWKGAKGFDGVAERN